MLLFVYFQVSFESNVHKEILRSTLWTVFFILAIVAGIAAWLFVLVHESRRVAEEETRRQTELLMQEIEAHKRTDAKLQEAKEKAEAASKAKSRYVVGLSHELRTPLNAVVGYAQILERDPAIPARRLDAISVVRRNAEYLSGLIDGLLDISKIEAGRFDVNRNEVRLREFLDQLVAMFRLQAVREGHRIQVCGLAKAAGGCLYGRKPAAPDSDQPAVQRDQVHGQGARHHARRLSQPGRAHRSRGQRHRHPCRGHRAHFPTVRARQARHGSMRSRVPASDLRSHKMLAEIMGGEITVRSESGRGSTFRVKLLLSEVTKPRQRSADRASGTRL